MNLRPTAEQEAILNATDRLIKINARAGTGKTSTLLMLAQQHPQHKILYLVFNKRAREEAQGRFPKNVTVHTVHSFANKFMRFDRFQRWKPTDLTAADFLPAYSQNPGRQHILATLNHQFLNYYLNSPAPTLEEAAIQFAENHLPENQIELFRQNTPAIIHISEQLFESWNKQGECIHDYYLKLFHKVGAFTQQLNAFDMVLVDEGQDLSPVMLDAISQCEKKLYLVGDSHQQIYSFRYAIDAMRKLDCDITYDLSLSFRFGFPVAKTVSVFINEAKKDEGFNIKGNSQVTSKVFFYDDLLSIVKQFKGVAILSRTNLSLFTKALLLRKHQIPFAFERDISPQMFRTLDVYWLSVNSKDRIRDPFIRTFTNLSHLEHFADEIEDLPLRQMAKVVRDYADEFPGAIFEIVKIAKENATQPDKNPVILSTIHSSKGQEYDQVVISTDVPYFLGQNPEQDQETFFEEVNAAYVALTRVKQHLFLPADFKKILSKGWQSYISRFSDFKPSTPNDQQPTPPTPHPPHSSQQPAPPPQRPSSRSTRSSSRRQSVPSRQSSGSTYRAQRLPSPKKAAKIGARVSVPNGEGTIVKIEGRRYLVDLDNQIAQVWEEKSNITVI